MERTINVKKVFIKEGASNKGGKTFQWKRYGFQDENGIWHSCFKQEYLKLCEFNGLPEIKEGDSIKCIVTEKEYQGKINNEISAPDKNQILANELDELKGTLKYHSDRLNKLELLVEKLSGGKTTPTKPPVMPTTVIPKTISTLQEVSVDDEDLPF